MDRRVPALAIAVLLGTMAGASVLNLGDRSVVSLDPGMASFTTDAGQNAVPVTARTVGPWRVERGYVFPAEGFPELDQDALLLIPGTTWPEGLPAWIRQRVHIPEAENATVRLEARNAAVLAGVPVTYSDRYCAASNVTVTVASPDREPVIRESVTVDHRKIDLAVDATRFAGRTALVTATIRPGDRDCGTARSNIVHLSRFAVEVR